MDLRSIPRSDVPGILSAIDKLSVNPRPTQSIKLAGMELYRLRYGRYRVVYEIKDKILQILIIRVRHRKDVYR